MKSIERDLKLFDGLYGLSCVENLLLYILKANSINYQKLYYDSFITISEIIVTFIKENKTYAYFNKIQRLQNIALDEGLINIKHYDDGTIPIVSENEYCLVMMNPEYIKRKYKSLLWREDHYILLSPFEDNLYYINDTPRDISQITISELNENYLGRTISIEINSGFDFKEKSFYLNRLYSKLCRNKFDYKFPDTDLLTFRDIIGVLRISRKRIYEFLSIYFDVEFMVPYLKLFDYYYTVVEYMRIKKVNDINKISEIRNQIIDEDDRLIQQLILLLGNKLFVTEE